MPAAPVARLAVRGGSCCGTCICGVDLPCGPWHGGRMHVQLNQSGRAVQRDGAGIPGSQKDLCLPFRQAVGQNLALCPHDAIVTDFPTVSFRFPFHDEDPIDAALLRRRPTPGRTMAAKLILFEWILYICTLFVQAQSDPIFTISFIAVER
jgi:hypothetical protein